jgi:hypothetical protein
MWVICWIAPADILSEGRADLRSRTVVATVTGVGHEPYGVAVVER